MQGQAGAVGATGAYICGASADSWLPTIVSNNESDFTLVSLSAGRFVKVDDVVLCHCRAGFRMSHGASGVQSFTFDTPLARETAFTDAVEGSGVCSVKVVHNPAVDVVTASGIVQSISGTENKAQAIMTFGQMATNETIVVEICFMYSLV